jgi:hypothetical protein
MNANVLFAFIHVHARPIEVGFSSIRHAEYMPSGPKPSLANGTADIEAHTLCRAAPSRSPPHPVLGTRASDAANVENGGEAILA